MNDEVKLFRKKGSKSFEKLGFTAPLNNKEEIRKQVLEENEYNVLVSALHDFEHERTGYDEIVSIVEKIKSDAISLMKSSQEKDVCQLHKEGYNPLTWCKKCLNEGLEEERLRLKAEHEKENEWKINNADIEEGDDGLIRQKLKSSQEKDNRIMRCYSCGELKDTCIALCNSCRMNTALKFDDISKQEIIQERLKLNAELPVRLGKVVDEWANNFHIAMYKSGQLEFEQYVKELNQKLKKAVK